jgi:hypothetical protein
MNILCREEPWPRYEEATQDVIPVLHQEYKCTVG